VPVGKVSKKISIFFCIFKVPEERSRIRSWIRIHTKMSQIPNNSFSKGQTYQYSCLSSVKYGQWTECETRDLPSSAFSRLVILFWNLAHSCSSSSSSLLAAAADALPPPPLRPPASPLRSLAPPPASLPLSSLPDSSPSLSLPLSSPLR
jgi:hypothetical protein